MRRFFDTLGFLTRLAPARVIPAEAMNQCMRYMVPVGALLGAAVALPFWLGLFGNAPWIQAWLMTALSVYLTRGLHLDGLADVCDAVAAHTDPELFWRVVKDSRSGAFGVVGLILALGGEVVLLHEMVVRGDFDAVIWMFTLGRAGAVWLGYHVRHLVRPGLGKLYVDGATLGVALATAIMALAAGIYFVGPAAALAGIILASLILLGLFRLAMKVNGANGDFLGCAVILGELAAGLGYVLIP
ncbi:MAG: adenosylcobinamide-GDP ribazoletransferase [Desulfovibrionaceae bacterium]|nr:adenosylcobinamide-GDP ribazoletransferase [Desulfovibrionaceae bacterium]